jgi:hypothetical protein
MKQHTFFEGVAVALAASLIGSSLFAALTPIFAVGGVLRLLIAGISLGYIVYLLGRSREHVGRVAVIAFWALLASGIWFLKVPLPLYLLVHLVTIWLIRSLYFYSSLLSALADLLLSGLSLSTAIWAFIHSGSLFLGIWSFFLMQALFVVIPARISGRTGETGPDRMSEEHFERAHRTAQAAVRKLSSIH